MASSTMATSMTVILNTTNHTKNSKFNKLPTTKVQLPLKPLTAAAASTTAAKLAAGVVFSTLSAASPAFAVQQLAEIADGDSRGQLLLIVVAPAILWVLYNILQPALNQINKMRNTKGVIVGLGLGAGLAGSGFFGPDEASAAVAEAAGEDNRGKLLLIVVAPAILWVLYNILQPALNQINKMRTK